MNEIFNVTNYEFWKVLARTEWSQFVMSPVEKKKKKNGKNSSKSNQVQSVLANAFIHYDRMLSLKQQQIKKQKKNEKTTIKSK